MRTVRQYIMICVNECMRARMRACMYVLKCVLHNVGRWGGAKTKVTPTGKSVSVSVRVVRAGDAELRELHP